MDKISETIAEAAKGLLYISETDAPFQVVEISANNSTQNAVLTLCGCAPGSVVEKVTLTHFFRNMVKAGPAAPAEEQEIARRFQNLQRILEEQLTNIEVYRIGTRTIDAVIVGAMSNGKLVTLRTKLVET